MKVRDLKEVLNAFNDEDIVKDQTGMDVERIKRTNEQTIQLLPARP